MIYLNNNDKNLINKEILESYNKTLNDYFVNKDYSTSLGEKSKRLYESAVNQIVSYLNIDPNKFIFTSSDKSSAYISIVYLTTLIGYENSEIIVSPFEKKYIYDSLRYLAKRGVVIKQVKTDENGLVDFNDLKKLMTEKTTMVIISQISADLGVRNPIKTIKQIVKKENSKTMIISDMSNAIGKISINVHDADICFFDSLSVGSPGNISLLCFSSKIDASEIKELGKMIYEPNLEVLTSFAKAIRLYTQNLDKTSAFIKLLNEKVITTLKKYDNILINTTDYTLPNMICVSLMDIDPTEFAKLLENRNIFIGLTDKISSEIMSIWHDEARAKTAIKISLASSNCFDDINKFLYSFELVYKKIKGEKE